MSEWREYKFQDLLEEPVRNGIYKRKEFHGRGTKIVNMGELFSYPRLIDVEMQRVEINENEKTKCLLRNGDLIFARRSLTAEGAGKCSLVYNINQETTFESSIIRARPNQELASPYFLYYLFNSPFGKYLLGTILRQVAVSGITGKDLMDLIVKVPTKEIQDKIAHILNSLDDKIDLLHRQNKTLEQLAETLFRQWFVLSQKSNVKREKFGKLVQFIKGRKPNNAVENFEVGLVPQILIETFDTGKTLYSDPTDMVIANEKDILMVMDGASSGRVEIGIHGIVGSTIGLFRPIRDFIFPHFLFYFLKANAEIITENTTGSAIPHTDRALVLNLDVEYTTVEKVKEFENIVENYFNKKQSNTNQIRTLTQLRDTLLPKLMSGEVRLT
ncbi:MAG: restriction endonuclease subunit S [Melioribacteraceae bacterium]|nr:restriction endonuclease subunit S [Melioribacteraceae bacterium]